MKKIFTLWKNYIYTSTVIKIYFLYNKPLYLYIFLIFIQIIFNINLEDFFKNYLQEYNLFVDTPCEILSIKNTYIYDNNQILNYTEKKDKYISIWEKLFGKSIQSNYKINPYINSHNITEYNNEYTLNIFKYALNKEKCSININKELIKIIDSDNEKIILTKLEGGEGGKSV